VCSTLILQSFCSRCVSSSTRCYGGVGGHFWGEGIDTQLIWCDTWDDFGVMVVASVDLYRYFAVAAHIGWSMGLFGFFATASLAVARCD
jgi:hypothetical protein